MKSLGTVGGAAAAACVAASFVACGNAVEQPTAESDDALEWPSVRSSRFAEYAAPAGELATAQSTSVNGVDTAILPNGRFLTPAGKEVSVGAPKPFGMAVSANGSVVATINSGSALFSVTLVKDLKSDAPTVQRLDVNASFMGVVISPDGKYVYASGGENGNLWVGEVEAGRVVGSVNLNGAAHPLDRPLAITPNPAQRFKGAFPGSMALTADGRFLYVVDQGSFQVFVVDTSEIVMGLDGEGRITEPDNFDAVVGAVPVGRYPFGIALGPEDQRLYVTNVGMFQYEHLMPENPTGDSNADYPLCFPGTGYPDDVYEDKTIRIKKIDGNRMSLLPASMRDPNGVRCGYVPEDRDYTIPALGDPNVDASSSLFVMDVSEPSSPAFVGAVKTGLLVGEEEDGIEAYAGSHPNSVAVGRRAIYVANGNNDSISVVHRSAGATVLCLD